MRYTHFALGLFALHASAAPFQYQPEQLANTTVEIPAEFEDQTSTLSTCGAKLEKLLEDLTNTTLSLLFGSTTATLGYAFCGLVMPPQHWETCTDFAVLGGSVVGLTHLAIWKLPEVLEQMDWYESSQRPWENVDTIAWGEDDIFDQKTEVKTREDGE